METVSIIATSNNAPGHLMHARWVVDYNANKIDYDQSGVTVHVGPQFANDRHTEQAA
jgi:hypothetical protein